MNTIVLPLWVFIILSLTTTWLLVDKMLIPSVRWMLRNRINIAIEQINTRIEIGIRPFQLTRKQVLVDRLVYDEEVLKEAQRYATEHNMTRAVAVAKVESYAKEIVPSFNAYIYYRYSYSIAKFLSRLFYRIRVNFIDNHRLKDVDHDSTIVFIMNHRSNVDYILLSHLVSQQTTLSYAIGEWAKIWPLHSLLQAMGGYFVRRNAGNTLYRKVLSRYIHMATKQGVCQAVFLEGGLSRDGSLRPIKLGILDYMLRDYKAGIDRDIVFIPIGINYDRTLEDTFLTASLNKNDKTTKKKSKTYWIKTTVDFMWRNFKISPRQRRLNYGYASLNFGHQISVRKFLSDKDIQLETLSKEQRFVYIKQLAKHLEGAIKQVIPVLPVPLVCSAMLNTEKNVVTELELKNNCHQLFDHLRKLGSPLYDSQKPKEKTLTNAINLLVNRALLDRDGELIKLVDDKKVLIEYYANSINHWLEVEEPGVELISS